MLNKDRDKYLTLAMNLEFSSYAYQEYNENNYSSWVGVGILLTWAKTQPWFNDFFYWDYAILVSWLTPDLFADKLYAFLQKGAHH